MSAPMLMPTPGSFPMRVIELEDGWQEIYSQGILKLQRILDFGSKIPFQHDEYVRLYSYVWFLCPRRAPCEIADLPLPTA